MSFLYLNMQYVLLKIKVPCRQWDVNSCILYANEGKSIRYSNKLKKSWKK